MHSIGIIGYGAFGRFLKQSWDELDNVSVDFITKTRIETVRHMAGQDGIPKYSSDYHDLIADPQVDIVVIATPPHLHERMAVEAFNAGKHVLVEKPLAMNPTEGENIIRAAEQSGRLGTVNFIMRYSGLVERLRTVCHDSLLGALNRVIVENYASDQGLGPDHWFWDRGKSGGIFIEHGVHFFDLVSWLVGGEVRRVAGFATERQPGIQDKVLAAVEYDNKVSATFYHAFSRPSAMERQVAIYVFDRGQIEVYGWIPMELRLSGLVSLAEKKRLQELFLTADVKASPSQWNEVTASGIRYPVAEEVELNFRVSLDKQQEYANCVRGLMSDLVTAIDDPYHRMRVTLDDGLASLRIAHAAASDV